MHKTLSFEDFSMGTAAEAEETLSPRATDAKMATSPPAAPGTPPFASSGPPAAAGTGTAASPTGARAWASVFNPGRNNNPAARSPGASFYDHVDQPSDDPRPVWDEVLKAGRLATLHELHGRMGAGDAINAADLRDKLGGGADVEQLIRAADKDGDGRVNFAELSELIRNS